MRKLLIPIMLALSFPSILQAQESTINITADEAGTETVFNWKNDRCFEENIPDSPARAFRSSSGQINLYATHYKNTSLIGKTLNELHTNCEVRFDGAMNSDPKMYNARIWLQTFYSMDGGKNIYSLGSSDYHGRWFKKCDESAKRNLGCWWSAIVLAHSDNGGISFKVLSPPDHIIAQSPHKFSDQEGGPVGFLTTSNIVKIEDHYYSLFNVAGYKEQQAGNCLGRTKDLTDASSWRIWDGKEFSLSFYRQNQDKNTIHCVPVDNLPQKVRSLLWHTQSEKYIAVFEEFKSVQRPVPRVDAVFSYSWSSDLINWHSAKKIITIRGKDGCQPQSPAAYPSMLDGNSTDVNFGTIGESAYLYYTRFNLGSDCKLSLDRDLVRTPIKLN